MPALPVHDADLSLSALQTRVPQLGRLLLRHLRHPLNYPLTPASLVHLLFENFTLNPLIDKFLIFFEPLLEALLLFEGDIFLKRTVLFDGRGKFSGINF